MQALSLQQRRRKQLSDEIAQHALQLFIQHSYHATTMQMVADASRVGVATVFRYFNSKPGLLAAIIRRDLTVVLADSRTIAAHPTGSLVADITALLLCCLSMLDRPSKDILHVQWTALNSRAEGGDAVESLMTWAILELKKQIRQLLRYYRRRHMLSHKHRIGDYVEIILAVFNEHYTHCLMFGEITSRARPKLVRRIHILFEPWLEVRRAAP